MDSDSSSSSSSSSSSNDDNGDTTNGLDFSMFSFYGRKKELERLHDIYTNVCQGKDSPPQQQAHDLPRVRPTFISGCSGTGKSSLVEEFIKEVHVKRTNNNNPQSCYFVSGKYGEETWEDHPFSAIVEAFGTFLYQLRQKTPVEWEAFQKRMHLTIGKGVLKVLSFVIPDFQYILMDNNNNNNNNKKAKEKDTNHPTATTTSTNNNTNSHPTTSLLSSSSSSSSSSPPLQQLSSGEQTRNRLKYAFQTLLNVLCNNPQHPFIMFLDDMQWADPASLDLLSSLFKDSSLKYFMFIGAMRPSSASSPSSSFDHPNDTLSLLSATSSSSATLPSLLEELSINNRVVVETISLSKFSEEETSELICDLLGLYPNEVLALTEVVYTKTKGNIFFIMQVLKQLEQQHLLFWCTRTFRWQFRTTTTTTNTAMMTTTTTTALLPAARTIHPEQIEEKEENNDPTPTTMTTTTITATTTTATKPNHDNDNNNKDFLHHNISDNVIDVITHRIKNHMFGKELQLVLGIAAYIGKYNINIATLQVVIHAVILDDSSTTTSSSTTTTTTRISTEELIELLDIAVLEGMLSNALGSTSYKFVHDQIQQAARSLIIERPSSSSPVSSSLNNNNNESSSSSSSSLSSGRIEIDHFHEKMGLCLYELWSRNNNHKDDNEKDNNNNNNNKRVVERGRTTTDWMLFVAADHLHAAAAAAVTTNPEKGGDHNKKNEQLLLQVVRVHLEAGEKASALAAFHQAVNYLKIGIYQLKNLCSNPPPPTTTNTANTDNNNHHHWVTHYAVSIRLYRAIVDAELVLGHFEIGNQYAKEIFMHSQKQDQFPTYMSLAMAIGRQDRHEEANDLCWKALTMLGEKPIIHSKLNLIFLIKGLLHMKLYFQTQTDDKILSKPILQDRTKLTAMRFYDEVCVRTHVCGNLQAYMLAILRKLRISFKYGLSPSTAVAIGSYSVFVGMTGDHTTAMRLARLARKVAIITKGKDVESKVLFLATRYTEDWSCPTPAIIKTYEQGYKAGMEVGDTEFAFYNLVFGIRFLYNTGHSLDVVHRKSIEALTQCRIYNVNSCSSLMEQIHFSVLHLQGLSGVPRNWKEINEFCEMNCDDDASKTGIFIFGCLSRLELSVYFGEYSFAPTWINILKKIAAKRSAVDVMVNRLFYSGLVFSALARQSGKRKYYELSKKEAKELKNKIKARESRNYSHRYLIMQAELMTLHWKHAKNIDMIEETFMEAIDAAMQVGHVNDAALGSELAGEHFLYVCEVELARKYLTQARDLYHEWGAFAKVEHLQTKRGCYIDKFTTEEVVPSICDRVAINDADILDSSLLECTTHNMELAKGLYRIPEGIEITCDAMSKVTEALSCVSGNFSNSL